LNELISVIIPLYNKQNTIARCINSVCSQEYDNIEIIIVNDGSTDGSLSICREYEKKDKRVKIVNKNNEGVSKARNDALLKSNGKYIFFIDADDMIEKMTLSNLIEKTINNNNAGILVGTNFKEVNNKIKKCNYGNTILSKSNFIEGIIKGEKVGTIWNYLFNKELIGKKYI